MNDTSEYILDPETRAYIAELQAEMQRVINPYQVALQTAISLTIRQNKLKGGWRLSDDGSKLVCVEPQPETVSQNGHR
jgi:hypothetical protein